MACGNSILLLLTDGDNHVRQMVIFTKKTHRPFQETVLRIPMQPAHPFLSPSPNLPSRKKQPAAQKEL
jgi:hypothetical protein